MPGSQDLFGLITVREKFPSVPVVVVSASEELSTINRSWGMVPAAIFQNLLQHKHYIKRLKPLLKASAVTR